ncbi:MAG: DUF1501 domain-containing protein [Akkermansiaceae bacterium]|nr:DUF1501 domain-containing protein [Akkermansiaceae bacterium]NNM28075.1 DUF1501 domain-containing protein [Akkermansiaceae bacterium]
MNRRKFLADANCAALSSVGILSTIANLRMIGNAAAGPIGGPGDYRALVCLFLHGGNDSFNMVVPTETAEYDNYAAVRTNLALPAPTPSMAPGELLPLNVGNTPGRTFGLHPAMPELRTLFDAGDAALVANVGTLVEPTTIAQYKNKSVSLPRSLFSHNDQQREWQTSVPQTALKTGWAGRLADRVMGFNPSNTVSMNISLNGTNLLQTGDATFAYAIGRDGARTLTGAGSGIAAELNRVDGAKSLAEQAYRDVLRRAYADEATRSYDTAEAFSAAFNAATVNTAFPEHSLSENLEAVAKSIAARGPLGHNRQIFFVQYGGFDNHGELLVNHDDRLGNVDQALKAFWDSMVELGLTDDVTLFTCSDFGRTLRSNGQGTDHAWGGNAIVLGGCVNGSNIYGTYPDDAELAIGTGLDVGFNGRVLPTTSCDEYFAELALWFGLPSSQLEEVLPNLDNFYSYSPTTPPLGILL